LYTPGPSIEIETLVVLVVDQLAVNFWKSPLWQSMFSGVVKLAGSRRRVTDAAGARRGRRGARRRRAGRPAVVG
jgi:hypothetical protein